MKIHFLCIVAFLFLESLAFAGNPKVITGKIMDGISHEPLPFANILCAEIGTTSNEDGDFVLVLANGESSAIIEFRYIGFESVKLELTQIQEPLIVAMQPSAHLLDGVTIVPTNEIIEGIYNHFPSNYEFEDQQLSTYYKESLHSDKQQYYLAEGILNIFYPTIYSNEKVIIETKKTRKQEFVLLDTTNVQLMHGHASDMLNCVTRRKDSFISPYQIQDYYFTKEGMIEYDGREVYVFNFEPKNKKGTSKGKIYVDAQSNALIKTEYFPIISNQNFWTFVKWTEEYIEIDGTWYINHVTYTGEWKNDDEVMTYNALLVVTDFKAMETITKSTQAISKNDIFFNTANGFNEDFWEGYNHVKLSIAEKSLLSAKIEN